MNRFNIENFELKNKIIVDFVGLQTAYQDVQIWMDYDNSLIPEWDNRDYWLLRELKFHVSWDWLIPVVDKIRGLKVNTYTISDATEWANLIQSLNKALQHVHFIALYEAVVGIIMFLNKQNITNKKPPLPSGYEG